VKIAIVTPFYYPSIGGVENTAYHHANFLNKKHDVIVLTTDRLQDGRKIRNSDAFFASVKDIEVIRHPCFFRIGYTYIWRGLHETINNLNFDIIHSHVLGHFPEYIISLFKNNEKFVVECHFPNPEQWITKLLYKTVYKMTLQKLITRKAIDAFIVHGPNEKQMLHRQFQIPYAKIKTIHLGCPHYYIEGFKERKKIIANNDVFEILFVGSININKGLEYLLKAVKDFKKEFKLRIVGSVFDEKYYNLLIDLVKNYNLQDKVIFEGPKNQRELFSFYTRANMFILSSIREGLPCVLLEAQAFGIPIIATNISDIPYAILNNKTGILVPPADSIAIREAIHMLLDDPKFGEEIGKQAHLRMKKDFDWNRIGRNLEKTYEELVACPRIKKQ